MAGKYGCPWTNIMCIQSCGCCRDCEKANSEDAKYSPPSCACEIFKNNKNKPEIEDKNDGG